MLQLRHIRHTFRQQTVLSDLSLEAAGGDIVAVLGSSGSGKSTLLNIIAGLLTPQAGEVYLDGVLQNPLPPEQRRIAMMFQDFALLPHLNVWQNAAFGLRMRGMAAEEARRRAETVLADVGLSGFAERPVNGLSGGEQQRVALARALCIEPRLLLLDEPFSSLDTALRGRLQQQVVQTVRKYRIPAVLVSHDPAEACRMAARIALLDGGRIIQSGTPEQVLAHPADARAAKLMGCRNVSDAAYIPPEALRICPDGVLCTVEELFRQPEGWCLHVRHPKWGSLMLLSQRPPLHDGARSCRIGLDENRIIRFSA